MSAAEETLHGMSDASAPIGAGRLLRGARERSNLTVGEVATRLRLDVRRVRAIESDDYSDLPAPTFVRGYLYSYSRLLQVPSGPIMEAYDRQGFGPPPLVADIAESSQARSSDFPVRVVTYAIAILLGGLVVLWWHGRQESVVSLPEITRAPVETVSPAALPGDAPPVPDASSVVEGASTPLPAIGTDGGTQSAAFPVPPGEPLATVPGTVTAPAAPSSAGAATSSPAAGAGPAVREPNESAGTETVVVEAPVAAPKPGTLTEARVRAPGIAEPPPVALATPARLAREGEDALTVRLRHDSWVEISDAQERRLFYDLAREGTLIDVSGRAPFRVLLGYARDAEVRINGTAFDYAPFVKREIARFEVGAGTNGTDRGASAGNGTDPAPTDAPPANRGHTSEH